MNEIEASFKGRNGKWYPLNSVKKEITPKFIYGSVSISGPEFKNLSRNSRDFLEEQMKRFESDALEFIKEQLKQLFEKEEKNGI